MKDNKKKTVHVHRTIMFQELEKVMDFGIDLDTYTTAMEANVFGKKSADGIKQTSNFLSRIYLFDPKVDSFKVFKYFWKITSEDERPLMVFLFAFTQDHLLFESAEVVAQTPLKEKVTVEAFKENLERYYPNKYSAVTSHSIGKNLASSWKQAGFIEGKTKNIRVQPEISYKVAAFAFFLAFLEGDRGEFILKNPTVKSLCLSETKLRDLAIEAAKQELLQYQYSGSVTSFAFPQLISKLQIFD
ncbi:hypothetical protein [Mongoliitalea lutea]|nr:hypothetical protein [Mongoliitalea lutea]